MYQLTIPLTEASETPLYAQIYEYIKEEIKAGRIPAYSRLPSTRKLADVLAVSRSTVQLAYDQLSAEGYLDAEPCRGYYAADVESVISFESEKDIEQGTFTRSSAISEAVPTDSGEKAAECVCDFSPAGVDLRYFPYPAWRRLTREVFSDSAGTILRKGLSQGEPQLRQAIAGYLHGARGFCCSPEQIVVGAGNEYLLMLLSQMMGGDCQIAMENPTYYQAYRVFTALGHTVEPVDLDSQGIRMDILRRSRAQLAYVMPSHQYPTGTVMPIGRRMELLDWAEKQDAYLIEDDYDSEFRYRGRPIPALASVDEGGRVVYLGTFSRAIAPAIRISFLVLPQALLARYREVCGFYACTVPRADQEVLARFLSGGHFERHLNRMRGIYREKRETLMTLLGPLEPEFRVWGDEAGVHLLISSQTGMTEEEMVRRAALCGVTVYGLSRHCIDDSRNHTEKGTVLVGFARQSEAELEAGAAGLVRAWKS